MNTAPSTHLEMSSILTSFQNGEDDKLSKIGFLPSWMEDLVFFGPEANCSLDICDIAWSVYKYRPSMAANIAFMVLYALALSMHVVLGIRWRSWWFMAFIVAGCVSEIIGYAGRLVLYENPWSFSGFLIQVIMITGAPVYFTAAIYVTLSKTIEHFSADLSRVQPKLFYWFFIPADVICLLLQAVGGALSTMSKGVNQNGIDVAMTGLILQVIIISVFLGCFGDYMFRYFQSDLTRKLNQREKLFFGCLGLATTFILGRCIYRCYELKEGYTHSTLITDEPLFIGLEGVLVYLAVLALFIGHPGFIFQVTDRRGPEMVCHEEAVAVQVTAPAAGK